MTNFHTHTQLCKHAEGLPDDYVRAAAEGGCTELGISDHCPYPPDKNNTWPHVRMTPEETAGYMALARAAAKSAPMPVYAGFECEYAPCYESWYRDTLLGEYGADYLVLGQHWLPEGAEMVFAAELTDKKSMRSYIDLTIRAMQTGIYSFLAHPDLLMADGRAWSRELEALFSDLIDAAMGCGMLLEINGYGLRKPAVQTPAGKIRRPYPVDEFWELAARKGASVICSSDAHKPANVAADAQKAHEYAARFGLIPAERPPLK